MNPRHLVLVSIFVEVLAGVALIALPGVAPKALLGVSTDPAGAALIRLAGVALISLAIMGWTGRHDRPAFLGLLAYNLLAASYLVILGLTFGTVGPVLWPAAGVHVVLSVLMVMTLGKAGPA